jgi:hypothetical protein
VIDGGHARKSPSMRNMLGHCSSTWPWTAIGHDQNGDVRPHACVDPPCPASAMTWQSSARPSIRFTKRALARSRAATASCSFFFSNRRWTEAGLFACAVKACACEARLGATEGRISMEKAQCTMVTWCFMRLDASVSTRTVNKRVAIEPSIMPVTRSSSRQTSQQPSNLLYASRRAGPSSGSGGAKKTPKSPSNEIIVLSSDDDEPPSKGTVLSKKSSSRTTKRKPAAPPVHSVDVLEISSDDESKPKKSSARKQAQSSGTNKDLERTIKKLQEVRLAICSPFRLAGVDSE